MCSSHKGPNVLLLGDMYTVINGMPIILAVKFYRLSATNLYIRNKLLRVAKL